MENNSEEESLQKQGKQSSESKKVSGLDVLKFLLVEACGNNKWLSDMVKLELRNKRIGDILNGN